MKSTIKKITTICVLFIIGAVIALIIYGIAHYAFHLDISKTKLIINVITDAFIFCLFSLVFVVLKENHSEK